MKINLSAIQGKIPKAAFGLFRHWTKEAALSDQLVIKNEQGLIADLTSTCKKAVLSLFEEADLDEKPLGWDMGFIIGFLQGNLGQAWHHAYIAKNSETYKTFAGLRAIESYLKLDEVAAIRINKLYQHILEEDSNIEDMTLDIKKTDLSLENLKIIKTSEEGKIAAILNNLIVQQVMNITQMENKIDLPIQDYFSRADIRQLINDNRHLEDV